LSASTCSPAATAASIRSIFTPLRPAMTAMPPGGSWASRARIRRGLDLQLPPGRRLALRVEAGNPAEVVDQLGPERRIDICFRRQARIHLLLYQRGMEMAGID